MTPRRRSLGARTAGLSLALAGLVGLGLSDIAGSEPASPDDPGSQRPVTREALVRSAALGCPGVDDHEWSIRAATAPRVLVDSVAADADQGAAGQDDAVSSPGEDGIATLRTVRLEDSAGGRDPEEDPEVVMEPGGSAQLVEGAAGVGAVLEGSGSSAPGLVAGQVAVSTTAGSRGALLAPCVQGAESLWLVGGDGGAGRAEQVVLTNSGSDPVQVDLEVHDGDGPVEVVGGAGIVVPPSSQVIRVLDALAPGVSSPAIGVRSTGGPVVAHLSEQDREGTTDLGRAVSAPVAEPALDLVVPALPTDQGELTLRVLAPQTEALVEIRALGPDGAAAPATAALRVPAGSTAELPLEEVPEGITGLSLRSDSPVTAAVQLRRSPSGDAPIEPDQEPDSALEDESEDDQQEEAPVTRPAGDFAWVGATLLQTEPLAMTVPRLPQADPATSPEVRVQLSVSVLDATTAQVLWLDEQGETSSQDLTLANDTSVLVDVPESAAALWVRSTGGSGVAAALHLSAQDDLGPYIAAASLPPAPWTREVTEILRTVP